MRHEVRICIDTCAYTAFRNGSRRALDLFDTCDELIFPVTVIGELNFGFSCGSRYAANMDTLSDFIVQSAARIAPVTAETAYRYGRLATELRAKGRPMPQNDIWIAAIAMEQGARLATLDSDFGAVPGLLVEWL